MRQHMERYFLDEEHGEVTEIGVIRMRLLVPSAETGGTFTVVELRGSEGPWTVPHIHQRTEESFYVLEGSFQFTVGDQEGEVTPGTVVRVPRGTRHIMRAGPGGGALLTYWVPGGLEEMFRELGRLPAASVTDPEVRAEIAKRYDSIPA